MPRRRRPMFMHRRRRGRRIAFATVVALIVLVPVAVLSGLGSPTSGVTVAPPQAHPVAPPHAHPRPAGHPRPKLRLVPPATTPETRARLRLLAHGLAFYCGRATVREVAVTFDDGPSRVSGALLSLLRRAEAPATFFQIGINASRRPKLARAEAAAGEVGNHTLDHKDLDRLTLRQARHEITAGEAAIASATGVRPVLFRPPYDVTTASAQRLVRTRGLLEVLWSVDSRDWQNGPPAKIRRRVLAQLRPGGIILLHEQAAHTIPTLRWLLRELRQRHLRPVTVSRLLADATPRTAQLLADRRGRTCVEFPYRGG